MCIRDRQLRPLHHRPLPVHAHTSASAGAMASSARRAEGEARSTEPVSYTHLRAHETRRHL
eukprot:4142211-Prorocentrum_lima.AAC.1